jgi:hypothetical protein
MSDWIGSIIDTLVNAQYENCRKLLVDLFASSFSCAMSNEVLAFVFIQVSESAVIQNKD